MTPLTSPPPLVDSPFAAPVAASPGILESQILGCAGSHDFELIRSVASGQNGSVLRHLGLFFVVVVYSPLLLLLLLLLLLSGQVCVCGPVFAIGLAAAHKAVRVKDVLQLRPDHRRGAQHV